MGPQPRERPERQASYSRDSFRLRRDERKDAAKVDRKTRCRRTYASTCEASLFRASRRCEHANGDERRPRNSAQRRAQRMMEARPLIGIATVVRSTRAIPLKAWCETRASDGRDAFAVLITALPEVDADGNATVKCPP